MNLTPHYMPEVHKDIAEIGLYFAERDRDIEERFYQAVLKTVNGLAASPNLGERCSFRNPKTKGMRIWQVYGFSNYLIFYHPQDERLEVLRVLHGARDYAAMFNGE